MNRRLAMLHMLAVDALVSSGAEIEIVPIRKEYPESNAPFTAQQREPRYMPHIGKKQIAKALKRMGGKS